MTKQTVSDYTNRINQIVKDLQPENRAYFDQLEQYMNYASLTHDETKLYEQIYTMAVDLQEAERDGLTAEAFFGSQPKEMADELLANSPRNPLKRLAEFVGVFVAANLFLTFFRYGKLELDLLKLVLMVGVWLLGLWGLYTWMSKWIYKSPKKAYTAVIPYAVILGMVLPRLERAISLPSSLLTIPMPWDSLLILTLIALAAWRLWKVPATRLFPLALLMLWLAGLLEQLTSLGLDLGFLGSYWFKSLLVLGTLFPIIIWSERKRQKDRGLR